jgi:hypothetical protein
VACARALILAISASGIPEALIEKQVGGVTVDVHSEVKHHWQYLIDRNFVPYASRLSNELSTDH